MAKTNRIFATELNGYKKKQVDEYIIAILSESKQNKLESLNKDEEIVELKAQIAKLNDEISEKNAEIERLTEETGAAVSECEAMRADHFKVTKVLLDAESRAESIKAEAVRAGEIEKKRLDAECEDTRAELRMLISDISDVEASANVSADTFFKSLRDSLNSFEESVRMRMSGVSIKMREVIDEKSGKIEIPVEPACVVPVDTGENEEEEIKSYSDENDDFSDDVVLDGLNENSNNDDIPDDFTFAESDEAKDFFGGND